MKKGWWWSLMDRLVYGPRRGIDERVLWPSLKRQSEEHGLSLDDARTVMVLHAVQDEAWTTRYTHAEIVQYVKSME